MHCILCFCHIHLLVSLLFGVRFLRVFNKDDCALSKYRQLYFYLNLYAFYLFIFSWLSWPASPLYYWIKVGFPSSSTGKESACNAGDLGLIPGLGRSPAARKSYPLQYSGLENSMDCIVLGLQRVRHDWATFTITFKVVRVVITIYIYIYIYIFFFFWLLYQGRMVSLFELERILLLLLGKVCVELIYFLLKYFVELTSEVIWVWSFLCWMF